MNAALCSLWPFPEERIDRFLAGQRGLGFSYPDVGESRERMTPHGYKESHRRVLLGRGDDTFRRATAALRRWAMFDLGWMELHRPEVTPEPGAVVGVTANCWGVRWLNVCRVVYVIDEPGRYGFAYGTLPGHAERGEERFLIETDDAGDVWYDLYSFSRPAHWLAWLAMPMASLFQRKFGTDSLMAMVRATRDTRDPRSAAPDCPRTPSTAADP